MTHRRFPQVELIKAEILAPDSEQWLQKEENLASLDRGLAWAEKNKPQDNFKQVIKKLKHK